MNKILVIIGIIGLVESQSELCGELYKLSEKQLWNIVKLSELERIFILVAGSLSVVGLIITLCSWFLYQAFSLPSDLLFSIMCAELVENLSILASAIYFSLYQGAEYPEDFQIACVSIGSFKVMGYIGSLVYNVLFCIMLAYSLKNILKGTLFTRNRYHILALATVAAATLSVALTSNIGTDIKGVCGFRIANQESIARFVVELLICILCVYSMHRFNSKIPKNEYFQKQAVFGYYYYYMGIYTFIQVAATTSHMISSIGCRSGSFYTSTLITVSNTLSIVFSILLSFALIFLRWSHPILQYRVRMLLCGKEDMSQLEEEENREMLENDTWLGCLLESIKGSQILSFIAGISISFTQHEQNLPRELTPYHFTKVYVIKLNQHIADQYILKNKNYRESVIVRQKLDGLRTLAYEIKVYAPEVFTALVKKQSKYLIQSFDFGNNIANVKKSSYTNGGKSGQFFYGTYDHRFVFKTIKEEEALVYLDKMAEFSHYYQNNPHSLIVKILGVYRFARMDIEEKAVYIILMMNVSPVDRKFHHRVYDIKGSEFNRSTVQEKKIKDQRQLSKVTLKDMDFKEFEGRITLTSDRSSFARKTLRKDVDFLSTMGVMDYSVLIIKRGGQPQANCPLSELPSSKQPNIYYNIGIIDYLESWNLKRKAERAFKTMITNKEVTAASPMEYSQRLTQFLDTII